MSRARVVVIGAGVVGCAVARELAGRDYEVTVVDRGRPAGEASSAAAGMLAPLAEADRSDAFLELLVDARERFDRLPQALREETGIDVEFRTGGTIALALTPERAAELEARLGWQVGTGHGPRQLGRDEVAALEPVLARAPIEYAVHFPLDDQVDASRFSRAMAVAAVARGASMLARRAVREITSAGGAVTGVVLDSGEVIRAGTVIVAAGAWSSRLTGLPRPLPVRPRHGQVASVDLLPHRLSRVVNTGRVYAVPRRDGRVVLGATEEDRGYDKAITPAGLARILGGAAELGAELADSPLGGVWSGLRPATPDGRPILGPDPEVEGLHYATGHYRNGILLAPISAELVAAAVVTGRAPERLRHFGIGRFDAADRVSTTG